MWNWCRQREAVPVPAVAGVDAWGSQLWLRSGTCPPSPPDVPAHQHGQTHSLPSKRINIPPTPAPSSQGPCARVAMGNRTGCMFYLIIYMYVYNNMIRSQIMSSDFFPLIPAFQGMLAGLALCIIPQKSHSSRRRLIHEGAFYQADVSHMLYVSAWISLVETNGSKT